jgi:hypothetical protein
MSRITACSIAAVCNAIVRRRARRRLSAWPTFCSWKSEWRWLAACALECDPPRLQVGRPRDGIEQCG